MREKNKEELHYIEHQAKKIGKAMLITFLIIILLITFL